jgi:superfamily I DNA/RNA helicase
LAGVVAGADGVAKSRQGTVSAFEGAAPLSETFGDEADLDEFYDTERHLLYVACTRARDRLMVSGVAPGSEFLEDIRAAAGRSHGLGC